MARYKLVVAASDDRIERFEQSTAIFGKPIPQRVGTEAPPVDKMRCAYMRAGPN